MPSFCEKPSPLPFIQNQYNRIFQIFLPFWPVLMFLQRFAYSGRLKLTGELISHNRQFDDIQTTTSKTGSKLTTTVMDTSSLGQPSIIGVLSCSKQVFPSRYSAMNTSRPSYGEILTPQAVCCSSGSRSQSMRTRDFVNPPSPGEHMLSDL